MDLQDIIMKPERDRLVGTTLIPSYGKLPVHNKKFNQLIQYLEKKNKELQVPNPTEKQKALQKTIETQLNMERLRILVDEYERSDKSESAFSKILAFAAFRNWCGAGTNIYENIRKDLDNPSSMFKIDTICRDHDMRYTTAKTPEDLTKADDIMMEEIMKKYILNFDKNFITGDYERDYSTWSSSFNSLYNQVISLFEASIAINLIYKTSETFLNTAIEGAKLPFKIGRYIYKEYNRPSYRQLKLPFKHFTRNVGSSLKNVVKQATILSMGTVFRDKVYATIALFGIAIKKSIEEFFPINLISPVEHEVTDEQLDEIIKVFELLQNEYLMDSDMQPIKINDEWENEEIQIPPVDQLQKEIEEIVVMNKQYVEKRYEIAQQETIELKTINDELQELIDEMPEDEGFLTEINNELDELLKELNTEQTVLNNQDVLKEEEKINSDENTLLSEISNYIDANL